MKTSLTSLAVAVLALVGASSVFAQAASSPTREQVKKEAAAANKTTQGNVPTTEGVKPAKPAPSAKARADVKKEAAAANKTTQGSVPTTEGVKPAKAAPSTVSRPEVKKEAADAVKAGTTTSGQMSAPQKVDEGAVKKK